jgi:hypothetical protein
MVPTDVIDLLLPQAPARTAEHARTLIVFLRLLAADGRAAQARDAQLDGERARAELARLDAQARAQALEDLLAATCAHAQGSEGWAQHAPSTRNPHAAWCALLESEPGPSRSALELPRPGEGALELAQRLHAALEHQLGAASPRSALWAAHLERLRRGPAVAAPLFERAFLAARSAGVAPADCAALLAGQAACLLERGAVRAARALLESRLECVALDAGLARLLGCSLLASGEERAAAEFLRAGGAPAQWPASAVQLGRELESARPWFTASARQPESDPEETGAAEAASTDVRALPLAFGRERADFGALAFAVLALGAQGEGQLVAAELAPGARSLAAGWRDARELAWRRAGEAEHELAAHARPLRWQRAPGTKLRGAADEECVRALALEPIFGRQGELAGCVRLEFEHHLLPSPARLRALAAAWREDVLAALEAAPRGAPVEDAATTSSRCAAAQPDPAALHALERPHASTAAALRALAESLGMKLAQRRWWGFELERGQLRCVASDGGALADWRARPGAARALERSRACLAPVRFEEPSARLSIHADAASGLVLPVLVRARACAWLAFESSRKRDFRELDLRRCVPLVAAQAAALRRAQFADWHALAHGTELCAAQPQAFGLELEHVLVYASAARPIALCGPAGCGKRVLARWLHFESANAGGGWRELGCFGLSARALEAILLGARCAGVLLERLHELPVPAQLQLVRLLERAPARLPRVCASLPMDLREALAAGGLRPELAAAFAGLELRVPALAQRRAAIPALAQHALLRHARAEGRVAPSCSDSALACLWRQDWPGNLRQLEHFVYRLGLLAGEGVIEDALIADVARAAGLELRARCDSRAPVGESLRGALELTRKQNGAWNKTRAALYLGWDPDTLVLRMREAGLELDGTVEAREPLERPEPPGTVQAAADRVGTAAEAAAPTKPNALF